MGPILVAQALGHTGLHSSRGKQQSMEITPVNTSYEFSHNLLVRAHRCCWFSAACILYWGLLLQLTLSLAPPLAEPSASASAPTIARWICKTRKYHEQPTVSQLADEWMLLTTYSPPPLLTTRVLLHGIPTLGVSLIGRQSIIRTFHIPAPTPPSPSGRSCASLLQSCSPTAMGQVASAPSATCPLTTDSVLLNDLGKVVSGQTQQLCLHVESVVESSRRPCNCVHYVLVVGRACSPSS